MMISALKITADRIALRRRRQPHHVERVERGYVVANAAGMIAKYLATSLAMLERRQRAARHQQLLADLDDLDQLGRVASRGRPCCRLPWRPACRCSSPPRRRPAPARARRWCRRRSSRPAGRRAWYSRISLSFASGVASARKSSTPASAAIAAAVSGLSPVIITVLMPMRRSSAKRSLMPPLTMSLSSITPRTCSPSATTSGVRPAARNVLDGFSHRGRHLAALRLRHSARSHRRRPCGSCVRRGRRRSSASARRTARTWRRARRSSRSRKPKRRLRQHDDAAALGRLVGERSELRRIGEVARAPRRAPAGTPSPGGCPA